MLKRMMIAASFLILGACVQDEPNEKAEYTKSEASELNGTTPSGADLCDLSNWYGDGECDAFCPLPDADCTSNNDPECQSDADCAAGEVCEQGVCGSGPAPDCTTDADCAVDEVCESGACGPAPLPACSSDADCPAGEVCQADGQCAVVNTPGCTSDADCGANEICGPTGQCDPIEMAPPQCQTDSDCSVNEVCQDAVCLPQRCGGILGTACPDTHYCDYDETVGTSCGIADGDGVCQPRPEVCDTGILEVCGCDGMTYSNQCEANRAGTDIHTAGSCP